MPKKQPSNGGKSGVPGRDSKGRFAKGNKGGGRPKLPEELKEACKAASVDAINVLKGIMQDSSARDADRIRAAEVLLDRGYGKPVQAVDMDSSSFQQVVFVGGDDVAD